VAPLVIGHLLFLSCVWKKIFISASFQFRFCSKIRKLRFGAKFEFRTFFVPESRGTDSSGEDDSDEDDQNGNANDEVIAGSQSLLSGAASFVRANIVRKSIFVFSY